MLNFEYKGISAGKYVEGEIEALNNEEAADKLKQKKIIITKLFKSKKKLKIKKKNPFLLASVRAFKLKRFYYLPNSSLL